MSLDGNGRTRGVVLAAWLLLALGLGTVQAAVASGPDPAGGPTNGSSPETYPLVPDRPGLLVVEAAFDSSAGFRLRSLAAAGLTVLSWADGMLTWPAGEPAGRFGVADLTLPYGPRLVGFSGGGRLLFEPGRYPVKEPLLLTDGPRRLFLTRGEITIEPGRIVVSPSQPPGDSRAQFMLLAGIVLLITILMVRLRSRLKNR